MLNTSVVRFYDNFVLFFKVRKILRLGSFDFDHPLSVDASSRANSEYPHKPYIAKILQSLANIFVAASMGVSLFFFT